MTEFMEIDIFFVELSGRVDSSEVGRGQCFIGTADREGYDRDSDVGARTRLPTYFSET